MIHSRINTRRSENVFKHNRRKSVMVLRKKEGRPLAETADMKVWREEFNEMSLEDHDKVLKNLGLDAEDIQEFNDSVQGKRPKAWEETEEPQEEVQPQKKPKK